MDGLVEELFRLEGIKLKALTLVDAPSYDASVREQLRLLSCSLDSKSKIPSVESLLALSQLIHLNSRLLRNLLSTTLPNGQCYTAAGQIAAPSVQGRVSMEA